MIRIAKDPEVLVIQKTHAITQVEPSLHLVAHFHRELAILKACTGRRPQDRKDLREAEEMDLLFWSEPNWVPGELPMPPGCQL